MSRKKGEWEGELWEDWSKTTRERVGVGRENYWGTRSAGCLKRDKTGFSDVLFSTFSDPQQFWFSL